MPTLENYGFVNLTCFSSKWVQSMIKETFVKTCRAQVGKLFQPEDHSLGVSGSRGKVDGTMNWLDSTHFHT